MTTISANGIELYYERNGSGAPLLFLNGSGSTLAGSALLIGVFTARFDVVAHDQRGLGRTETPAGPYSMADYAADAIALLDSVGWDECRVLGVSFGGMVAQELAVTVPDRVTRLALCCTSPGGVGGASYPMHEKPAGLEQLDARFDAEWLATHPSDRGLAEMMAARRGDAPETPGEREQLLARARHDVCDRLQLVSCPTLVAGGRYDGIAPPANSEAIAARVPNADLRFYEGGHAFFAQDPRAFPEILDFLDG